MARFGRRWNATGLGNAEIRVRGRDGVAYAAPNLIVHYVQRHSYRPPQEFRDAVLRSPWGLTIPEFTDVG